MCAIPQYMLRKRRQQLLRYRPPREGQSLPAGLSVAKLQQKTGHPDPETNSPSSTSSPPRPIEAVKAGHRPVSFVKEGQHIKAKRKDKMRRGGSPHFPVHSGSGRRYSDVGDNHALCDKDCGWCGHCADEAGI
ncbi:hypothetical protein CRV24_009414 [Beauveria bassiana]|nr:hypothetical protein CRV24_009414 [Beauveria bassiana]KAH8707200.1 hypothetical protein HC256_010477 [Beauveria bassiana]